MALRNTGTITFSAGSLNLASLVKPPSPPLPVIVPDREWEGPVQQIEFTDVIESVSLVPAWKPRGDFIPRSQALAVIEDAQFEVVEPEQVESIDGELIEESAFEPIAPVVENHVHIHVTQIMRPSAETNQKIQTAMRLAEAAVPPQLEHVAKLEQLESFYVPEDEVKSRDIPRIRLIDENFTFDPSQIEAVEGLIKEQYGCLTGAAGTGKTTVTKKLIDSLLKTTTQINISQYWKKAPPDGDGEPEQRVVPAIAMVAFTGKASQMTKRNFPPEWHPNIMTIHRLLAFVPEWYDSDEFDPATGTAKVKMRFVPTYDATHKLPWDIIVIDECGMTSVDLWHQLWAACTEKTRIYFIGDINQLPPVHGRSVFGFGMSAWPTWELTHIHRQKGANNEIVDAAHDILNGRMPKSGGRFQLSQLIDNNTKQELNASQSSKRLRQTMIGLWQKPATDTWHFDPIRDAVIVSTNGDKPESAAYPIGQIPLNESVSHLFNDSDDRIRIDAGRERRDFAVGDKVMATRNDHDVGITNGMTGIITEIKPNGQWRGDPTRFGNIKELNEMMRMTDEEIAEADNETFDLTAALADLANSKESSAEEREKGRGPSSHIVTVVFGNEGDDQKEVVFETLAEVGSIQLAYVVTGHKMQGGEAPLVIILIHNTTRQMMNREWLYTAVTRASERCILLFTRQALQSALGTQRVKGRSLAEKVASFQKLQEDSGVFAGFNRCILPEARLYDGGR